MKEVKNLKENKTNQKDVIASVLHLSRVLRRNQHAGSNQGKGGHGRFRILRQLEANAGMTAAELAEKMDIRPASVSELIGLLVRENLVEKRTIPSDKRKQRLYITEEGRQLLQQFAASREQSRKRIEMILTREEQAMFLELCDKLIMGLNEGDDA